MRRTDARFPIGQPTALPLSGLMPALRTGDRGPFDHEYALSAFQSHRASVGARVAPIIPR